MVWGKRSVPSSLMTAGEVQKTKRQTVECYVYRPQKTVETEIE